MVATHRSGVNEAASWGKQRKPPLSPRLEAERRRSRQYQADITRLENLLPAFNPGAQRSLSREAGEDGAALRRKWYRSIPLSMEFVDLISNRVHTLVPDVSGEFFLSAIMRRLGSRGFDSHIKVQLPRLTIQTECLSIVNTKGNITRLLNLCE